MDAKVTVENIPILQSGNNDPWKDYSFVYVVHSLVFHYSLFSFS